MQLLATPRLPADPDTSPTSDCLLQSENDRLQLENALLRASLEAKTMRAPSATQDTALSKLKRIVIRERRFETSEPAYLWNSEQDCRYAHHLSGFEKVLHVFSQQWLGIRAAAGSLPGQKLALSAKVSLTTDELRSIIQQCDALRVSRFVFHGMSPAIRQLIERLSNAGLSSQLFIVYHGNAVQWCYEPERQLASQALQFARSGKVKRIHVLKNGHDFLAVNSYKPLLLNIAPNIPFNTFEAGLATALVPGSADWRKNLHCNALGAAMTAGIDQVLHFATSIELPKPYASKLVQIEHTDRASTLRLMSCSRVSLNVSLAECHPMVSLESEAVGTPCVRNPLFLDAHEDHPYVRLVEVSDITSPTEISQAVKRVISLSRMELVELIRDYLELIKITSTERYGEFLEL